MQTVLVRKYPHNFKLFYQIRNKTINGPYVCYVKIECMVQTLEKIADIVLSRLYNKSIDNTNK